MDLWSVDEVVDKYGAVCRARAGTIPTQDGSCLALPAGTYLPPVLISADKQGQPQPATAAVIPATYLSVLSPAPTTGSSRGLLKCGSHHALGGDLFPAYHPAQLRLAVGLARSTLPVRVRVVDVDAAEQPLVGYEVQRAKQDAAQGQLTATPAGVTDRPGSVDRVELNAGLNWLIIARGTTQLASRPVMAACKAKW